MPVPSFRYNNIFNLYFSSEGIPFTLKNRSIAFPEDETNPIYERRYVTIDTPWTVLSYTLYGTIEYWWVLAAINKSQIFYANEGSEILTISKNYIDDVMNTIKNQLDT